VRWACRHSLGRKKDEKKGKILDGNERARGRRRGSTSKTLSQRNRAAEEFLLTLAYLRESREKSLRTYRTPWVEKEEVDR